MGDSTKDIRTVLEYLYGDELADYCDQKQIPTPRARDSKRIKNVENMAARDQHHILGAIVRLGRRYLDWEGEA